MVEKKKDSIPVQLTQGEHYLMQDCCKGIPFSKLMDHMREWHVQVDITERVQDTDCD